MNDPAIEIANELPEIDAPENLTVAPDAVDVFRERCEARAYLVNIGEFALLDAVDGLQADADFNGLVDRLGQDSVQAIMARAFEAVP